MTLFEKRVRAERANEFIRVVARTGRKFFNHNGRISYFFVKSSGHVWFVDSYTMKEIYTHYKGRWKGFTNGDTLRGLVIDLRNYIATGHGPHLRLGPFPKFICNGDPWGYGRSMKYVRKRAREIFHGDKR